MHKYYNSTYQGLGHICHLIFQVIASRLGILQPADRHTAIFQQSKYSFVSPELYTILALFLEVKFFNDEIYDSYHSAYDFTYMDEEPLSIKSADKPNWPLLFQSYALDRLGHTGLSNLSEKIRSVLQTDAFVRKYFGINGNQKIAVIHIRDTPWSPKLNNTNPYNYIPTIHYFLEHGYHVVRIGKSDIPLSFRNTNNYTDLSFAWNTSHDVSLINTADVFIGCDSGPAMLPGILGKKALLVNVCSPVVYLGSYNFPGYLLLVRSSNRENTSSEILRSVLESEDSFYELGYQSIHRKIQSMLTNNYGYKSGFSKISLESFAVSSWAHQLNDTSLFSFV
jgi:hypothetical protein